MAYNIFSLRHGAEMETYSLHRKTPFGVVRVVAFVFIGYGVRSGLTPIRNVFLPAGRTRSSCMAAGDSN